MINIHTLKSRIDKFYMKINEMSSITIFMFVLVHFVVTWKLISISNSELKDLSTYLYFYITTITTVGYGDLSPIGYGRLVSAFLLMPLGIILFTIITAKLIEIMTRKSKDINNGMSTFNITNHIVIIGWRSKQTIDLINSLLSGPNKVNILLISDESQLSENPLPDKIDFVKGKYINDKEAYERACVEHSSNVIIFGKDDQTTLIISFMIGNLHKGKKIISYFKDEFSKESLLSQYPGIECVISNDVNIISRISQEDGLLSLYNGLMRNDTDDTLYSKLITEEDFSSVGIKETTTYQSTFSMFSNIDALLIGFSRGKEVFINPKGYEHLLVGDILHYISDKKLVDTKSSKLFKV